MTLTDAGSLKRWLPKRGLRRTITSYLGLVWLLALLFIWTGVSLFVYQTESAAWRGRQGEAARNAAQRVAAFVQRANDMLALIGLYETNEVATDFPDLVNQILDQNQALQEVVYLDSEGNVIAASSQDGPLLASLFTISQAQWFLTARGGQAYHSTIQFSAQYEPYMILAQPTSTGNVVAARLHMQVLGDVVADIRFGKTGRVYVMTQAGQIIAHTDPQVVSAGRMISEHSELRAALQQPAGEWYGEYADLQGVQVVGVTSAAPDTDWLVVAELPRQEAFTASRQAFLLLGGSLLLFGGLIMWISAGFLERTIFSPLEKLRDGAERIGQGNLSYRLNFGRQDEVGHLAAAFNEMAGHLEEQREALQQRNIELEHIYRLSLSLTSNLALKEVLDTILTSTFQLFSNLKDAHIFLYQAGQVIFVASLWADGRKDYLISEPRPGGLTYTVAQQGEVMVIPDIQADPSYHAPPEWHGALAGVPLKMRDRVVGVMNVAFSEPRVFQEKELRVLRLLGDQAAIAIENARLYEQAQQELAERKQAEEVLRWARDELELRVRERTAELAQKAQDLARSNRLIAALNQVVTNIAITPDPAEVMRTLGQELTRLNMGCLVAELDADKQALVISYTSLAPELLAAAEVMTGVVVLGWSIPLEAWGGAHEAIISRQPVFASDLSTIATGLLPFLSQEVIERSMTLVGIMAHTPVVYLPLMLEERFSGLLAVWGAELREDDLPALGIFTNQVAVTIENARLYTSEHEKTTALAQTSQQLQQELAERLRIETALQQSELKYRTLVEQIPAVAYMAALNPAGNTRYISPQIEALLNFSEADWLANPTLWSQQLHPDDRERVFAVMAESRKTGRSFCAEYRLFTRDGRVVWVRDDAKVIPDSTGEPAFLHGVLFDISAHKQAEAQIKASLQEKEILLQEIHHRVKNNLQIIASLLNLQSGYIEDPQTQETFRESQNRIRSMALIHEKLYRSENLARIDLGDYVHELAAFLFRSQGARHRGIISNIQAERIFLDIDTAVPCGLILNELVSNTLKHAFPNGRPGKVWIEFRADEPDQLTLTVADNGVGLPPGLDFRQTDSLGLQLVNTLVDQLGGIITLQSHHGARFKITFPCPPTTRTEP